MNKGIGVRVEGRQVVLDLFDVGKSIGFTPEQADQFGKVLREAAFEAMQGKVIEADPMNAGALQ